MARTFPAHRDRMYCIVVSMLYKCVFPKLNLLYIIMYYNVHLYVF